MINLPDIYIQKELDPLLIYLTSYGTDELNNTRYFVFKIPEKIWKHIDFDASKLNKYKAYYLTHIFSPSEPYCIELKIVIDNDQKTSNTKLPKPSENTTGI
jgi:hypothetical protein